MIPAPTQSTVTRLLLAWSRGQEGALDELLPLVEVELRQIAAHYLSLERPGHTLQPTALVNELFLRLVGRDRVDWKSRAQFFGFAAQTMRRILVDHARARKAAKRGGGATVVGLEEARSTGSQRPLDLVALDDALSELEKLDPRQSRIVELRFFAGLTLGEVAEVLEISEVTVSRQWASARAWLFRELQSD